MSSVSCDTCAYYFYDEEYEDDYSRLVSKGFKECPYYTNGDEYRVVRHQM